MKTKSFVCICFAGLHVKLQQTYTSIESEDEEEYFTDEKKKGKTIQSIYYEQYTRHTTDFRKSVCPIP